jgi:hypothetical protein
MASFSGYGKTIKLHSGDALVVHRSQDSCVVILEYEVHGKILSGGAPYDNRLISRLRTEKSFIGETTWILAFGAAISMRELRQCSVALRNLR